ncbi:hypothetical protein [Planococcus sp. YIM B11945]|uniref:hypothetical protein n=1 Tax=Planococcus sp. YIM B11945 TaxID=3435410 RepID=UPI003D7E691F
MEQRKIYRLSLPMIGIFMVFGILILFINILALRDALNEGLWDVLMFGGLIFIFPLPFIGYAIYLWRKRKEGRGFYWDDEGVVIDLDDNKVYWEEIESIQLYSGYKSGLSKATVIHPHYTNHEKIRERRKKWMPTPAHSIDWFMIEKPEEYHESVMKAWGERRHLFK